MHNDSAMGSYFVESPGTTTSLYRFRSPSSLVASWRAFANLFSKSGISDWSFDFRSESTRRYNVVLIFRAVLQCEPALVDCQRALSGVQIELRQNIVRSSQRRLQSHSFLG